jgi:2,3-bisphosphoglycerate-independent phosphoglycerate mutase
MLLFLIFKSMFKNSKPLVLVVLDGWGLSTVTEYNAIALANTPTYLELVDQYPNASLITNGEAVGLPLDQMGNSEVGHMNLGAGRVVYQDLTRIDRSIRDGNFFDKPEFIATMDRCVGDRHALHLIGLVSDGGVHSHQRHLDALISMASQRNISRVFVHVVTDGRDTAPKAGAEFVAALEQTMAKAGVGKIATITGRYYAMDRDQRWGRTQRAYDAFTQCKGSRVHEAQTLMAESYKTGITDEFIEPGVIVDDSGKPVGPITEGDSIVFFNFRADRVRQITKALAFDNFIGFERQLQPTVHCATMTVYDATFNLPAAFPPAVLSENLADVLADHKLTNLRLAETEKYAHVTYFFNSGEERPYKGEERILVPSQKVPTYDLKPEMSAAGITAQLVSDVENAQHDVIICNFANADMVGHTGKLEAAIIAVSTLDRCLLKIIQTVEKAGGTVIITADHGNAEQMWDLQRQGPHTAHTTNPVPILVVHSALRGRGYKLQDGSLRDVAPTILGILGVTPPTEMTGTDLRTWRR